MQKGEKRHDPGCGKPWGEHKINLRTMEWDCPGVALAACVCGDATRPGRHGREFCEPKRTTNEESR